MTSQDPEAAETAPAAGPRTGKPSMRERIIEAAAELFYSRGIRAVSAEKIIARVGITKVTFYRHFPSKDDLIVAYLERRAQWERDAVEGARQAAGDDITEVFRMIAEGIGAELLPGLSRLPVHQRRGRVPRRRPPGATGRGRPSPLVPGGLRRPAAQQWRHRRRPGSGRPAGDAARRRDGGRLPRRRDHRHRVAVRRGSRGHRVPPWTRLTDNGRAGAVQPRPVSPATTFADSRRPREPDSHPYPPRRR